MEYVYIQARKSMKERGRRYKLYHLSPVDDPVLDEMIPRVPRNDMVSNGFEDSTVKRISFANSIGNCLVGIAKNLTGRKFRVYALDYMPKGMYPSTDLVPDAAVTHEYWVTEKVTPVYLGVIQAVSGKPKDLADGFGRELARKYKDNPLQFIEDYYPDDWKKGAAIFKLYNEDKIRYRSFITKAMGKDRAYAYDWNWRWVERQ